MLYLSEVLMKNHDMATFAELKEALKGEARQGQMFFEMDVKPDFQDTPSNWQDECEAAFTSRD